MSTRSDSDRIAAGLVNGTLAEDDLRDLGSEDAERVVKALLAEPEGRRWLRASSLLDAELADRLVTYSEDFNRRRHDATLAAAVERASLDLLVRHAPAIAGGSGAPALWTRLGDHPDQFQAAFDAVLASEDARALEATATHLLLDSTGQFGLSEDEQQELARAIIETDVDAARGVATEFLASAAPDILASRITALAHDASASVRGFAWFAAFRHDQSGATDAAIELLGDESISAEIRRTALNAAGESLQTEQMVGLLAYFVVHPNRDLALDAAHLLHRHHRHPEIAIAAAGSPYDEVREIAMRLMDPYRGSPAAGGSRPGDPLRSDPLMQLLRQLEEDERTEE